MDAINLRSDTQTLPTKDMYEAMCAAELGDDTAREDPTVNRLERMAAERMGKEAALLVLSGTMGNLVSLMTHGRPGDEVVMDAEAHVYHYEVGGLSSVAGLVPMLVPCQDGLMDPAMLRAKIRKEDIHYPSPRILSLENTHNRGGGRVVPVDLHVRLCQVAREHDMAIHLDGARVFNAALAAGVPVAEYTTHVDSVTFCLSKGLSCPVGALIAGSEEFIHHARRNRRRIGGGMRQAGIFAAAGIVALESMVDRLADDHANARLLAEGVSRIDGLSVNMATVESNMVNVDHTPSGLSTNDVLARLAAGGVLASGRPPDRFRLVTNRHHDRATVEEAVGRIRRVMADLA